MCPQSLFPSPLLVEPLARCSLPLPLSLATDPEVRAGQGGGTAGGVPKARRGRGGGLPASQSFSYSLPWFQPPPAPRPWGVTTEGASSSSCPAVHPAALQGSADPELNPWPLSHPTCVTWSSLTDFTCKMEINVSLCVHEGEISCVSMSWASACHTVGPAQCAAVPSTWNVLVSGGNLFL